MSSAVKQALSPKAILIAMGGACLLYASMIGISLLQGSKVIQSIENKMTAQSIPFDRPVIETIKSKNDFSMLETEDLSDAIGAPKDPLPPAPYDGLTEETQFGSLPMIGKNKLKPFEAYKKPFVADVKKPILAIGVRGIGFSGELGVNALSKLTPQVSLILSAYVDSINDIQKKARAQGYETWLEIPFENQRFPYSDPGPKGILVNAGLKFNQDNYRSVLASTNGYAGVAGYTDGAFKDSKTMLSGVLSDAYGRGLGFFEMNTGRSPMSGKLAIEGRAAFVQASVPLQDHTVSMRFEMLKKAAKRDREAVGVIEVSPAMLAQFQTEILKAQKEGFQIAPLSAVVSQF